MRRFLSIAALFALTHGCGAPLVGDGENDSFGGAGGKADGTYNDCQLAEVLKLVNESTTTVDSLRAIGLTERAATGIWTHRVGPDGQPGTGDDDLFDNLQEVDDVPYVGKVTLNRLVSTIAPRCEADLTNRPYIDDQTFANAPAGGYPRDDEEVEGVYGVEGITSPKLRELLLTADSDGRTLYEKIRKNKVMEGFAFDYGLDEMPWDKDRHAAREQLALVALTIEPGRFDPNEDGVRELSLGTDIFDDSYFDTNAYTLLSNGIELRARARWDSPTEARRLLVGAKFGTTVDAAGNKVDAKVDVRTDSGQQYLATLDDDVRRGLLPWNGTPEVAIPVKGVYEELRDKHALLDVGGHHGVLLLDAKAHLRSTRSRFHLNEARIDSVLAVYRNGATRIQQALDLAAKARQAGIIPAGSAAQVEALERMGRALLDKSALIERAQPLVKAIDPALTLAAQTVKLPDTWQAPASANELEIDRVLAETQSALYHEFANALDDADRAITDAADESFDPYVDMFIAWRVSLDKTLAKKTTIDPFLQQYDTLTAGADKAAQIAAFNSYGEAQKTAANELFTDFAPLADNTWTGLGNHLRKAMLTVGERQIESAGTAARQVWFDLARKFWVPGSYRVTSNFMIDTFDMVDMLSNEEWASATADERSIDKPLPAAKVFKTVLVDELQIELGSEKAYTDRIHDLEGKLQATPGDAELERQLAGAKFVYGEYKAALKVLAQLKGDGVLSRLRKAGAPKSITWVVPPDSKGNQALKQLAGRQ